MITSVVLRPRMWKMSFLLKDLLIARESEGPAISSQREAVINGNAASIGSYHRFSITSQVPITGPVILASHLLSEERQNLYYV